MPKAIDQAKAEAKEAKADAKFEAKIDKMVEHLEDAKNPEKALNHFEAKLEKMGANVFVADPSVQYPDPVYGTAGQHDVFIYDYATPTLGSSIGLRDFTPGEDYIVFANMDGVEMDMGSLAPIQGSFGVFFHSNPGHNGDFAASTLITMRGIPYDLDVLQHTILGVSDIKYGGTFDIG